MNVLIPVLFAFVAALYIVTVAGQTPNATVSWSNTPVQQVAFFNRTFAGCANTPLSRSNPTAQTMFLVGGYLIVNVSTGSTNQYYNDVWSSSNGVTWTRQDVQDSTQSQNGLSATSHFSPNAFFAGVGYLSPSQSLVVAGGENYTSAYNNQVYVSSGGNNGNTFTLATSSPGWFPRDNTGYGVLPNTNTLLIALGDIPSADVTIGEDIWYEANALERWHKH